MNLEFHILQKIWELHHPLLDFVMILITRLGDMGIIWMLWALYIGIIKKDRKTALHMVFALALSVVVGSLILKPIFARHRPSWVVDLPLLIENPKDFSFPSGHTYSGFAASTALYLHHKKQGIFAFCLALCIAFSRLYHFVHFPTDILGGMLLGIGSALFCHIVYKKYIRKVMS